MPGLGQGPGNPEYVLNIRDNQEANIWSYGVMLFLFTIDYVKQLLGLFPASACLYHV